MGQFGSIVLYPTIPVEAGTMAERRVIAEVIIAALTESGFFRPGAVIPREHNPEVTFATSGVYEDDLEASEEIWLHVHVPAKNFQSAIANLVYSDSEANWFGTDIDEAREPSDPDSVAVPVLDLTIFEEPVQLWDGIAGEVACESNIFIEFSFYDARLSEEIHRIRDEEHPVFGKLADVLGSSIAWTVVCG